MELAVRKRDDGARRRFGIGGRGEERRVQVACRAYRRTAARQRVERLALGKTHDHELRLHVFRQPNEGRARVAAALIRDERAQGREPVWGATEDNVASLRLARRLGFVATDELWLVTPDL
jgi:hypothetical protein